MSSKPLRVAIDARLVGGQSGGVESVVIGLAHGLSSLPDGEEQYLFYAWSDEQEWLRPYIGGSTRIWDIGPRPVSRPKEWLKTNLPIVQKAWHRFTPYAGDVTVRPPWSDGKVEASGAELIHFTTQPGFLTKLPTIYHPHDLQHRHLPQYFSPRDRLARDVVYETLCGRAALVAVASSWVKRDVVEQFGIEPENVVVIPLPPILWAYPEPVERDLERVQETNDLPAGFILYPAQTWAHKNHLGLLEAIAILRDEHNLRLPLVCSGRLSGFFPTIERRMHELRLGDQVQFLGFVSPLDLQCLYRLATATVIPTKFEAASGPLWDAFLAGSPAACSTVTALPEQAGDAALLFDPDDARAIAEAVRRLWLDADLRSELARRGRANVARFSWDSTARTFRAHYRRIVGRPLSDEDTELLEAPPLI